MRSDVCWHKASVAAVRLYVGNWGVRLPSLAAELVGRDVAVIFAVDLPSAFAAKAATKTIPIVFRTGADPVKVGLVDSLSRPAGNLTGMSVFISILGPKRVELLHELLPAGDTIALLANANNVNIKTDEPEIQAAADRLRAAPWTKTRACTHKRQQSGMSASEGITDIARPRRIG